MKYKYAIIDKRNVPYTIFGNFKSLDEAKNCCYMLRKKRYSNGNILKEVEYDRIKVDVDYNVIKISDELY